MQRRVVNSLGVLAGLLLWAGAAQALSIKESDYVLAATAVAALSG